MLLSPDGLLALLFIGVPEPKQVKNRVHLDLVPLERRRDEEVDRLLGIGARGVDDQRRPRLTEQARPGRFGPAQIVADHAPAIERLVALLGRPVNTGR